MKRLISDTTLDEVLRQLNSYTRIDQPKGTRACDRRRRTNRLIKRLERIKNTPTDKEYEQK